MRLQTRPEVAQKKTTTYQWNAPKHKNLSHTHGAPRLLLTMGPKFFPAPGPAASATGAGGRGRWHRDQGSGGQRGRSATCFPLASPTGRASASALILLIYL